MKCENVKECACPNTSCSSHGLCCSCVVKHRNTDSLPHCLFPNNEGNKKVESYYKKLKERFEG